MNLTPIPGHRWIKNGQSNFSGPALDLFVALDRAFCRLAEKTQAKAFQFPVFIQASELQKLDYFRSFPHLVTFPITLDPSKENLLNFNRGSTCDSEGQIHLTQTTPICDCLTPAACYHFYIHHQGQNLSGPLYLTTRALCFRREEFYLPLQRQWQFNMREIVCIGSMQEVQTFLQSYQDSLNEFFKHLKLDIRWEIATDPFFDATRNPKYVMQTLDPVKQEMIFGDKLSIGSINFHKNYFGDAFAITRDGEAAFSGCVAFGLERWVHAIAARFGTDPDNWPLETLNNG